MMTPAQSSSPDILVHHPVAAATPGAMGAMAATPSRRREVRGGFPVERQFAGQTEAAPGRAETPPAAQAPVEQAARIWSSASTALAPPRSLPPAEDTEAITKLIERSVLPMPMPGLGLRLFAPDEPPEARARAEQAARDEPVEAAQSPPLAPASAQPPLDINEVADKVFQTLQRRQQLERERRGFY